MSQLKEYYGTEVVPKLVDTFQYQKQDGNSETG